MGYGHMTQDHATRSRSLGARVLRTSARKHGGFPYAQGPENKGLYPNISPEWVLYIIIVIFNDIFSRIEVFWSFWGDIGPFFRLDLGGKFGYGYQLQIYKKDS
jgi:hypothetical protein